MRIILPSTLPVHVLAHAWNYAQRCLAGEVETFDSKSRFYNAVEVSTQDESMTWRISAVRNARSISVRFEEASNG